MNHRVFRDCVPALTADEASELDAEGTDPEAGARRFLTAAEVENLPKPEYRMEDVLVMGSLAVLYGPPGCFKSFLALAWSLSIASGFRWEGHSVVPGPVIYIAGEGSAGLGARLRAWKLHNHYAGEVQAYFLTSPARLIDDVETSRLLADITDELDEMPALIVVDTLSRDLAGADENSQAEMSQYVKNLDRIRAVTGATVLVLHHTNASAERERGSTVLRGAADTMIQIKKEDDLIVVSCEKQKDAAPFANIHLELIPVAESAVLGRISDVRPRGLGLTPSATEVLAGLAEGFTAHGATNTDWKAMFPKMHPSSFQRARKHLLEGGYVNGDEGKRGSKYTVSEHGEKHLVAIGRIKVAATESVKVAPIAGVLEDPASATNTDDDYERWEQQRLGAA